MMDEFDERISRRAWNSVVNLMVMCGNASGLEALEDRRRSCGRSSEPVVRTFKALWSILEVAAIAFSLHDAATGIGGTFSHIFLFVVLAVVFSVVAALSAWTVTVIALGASELADSVYRTKFARSGHFLTPEELQDRLVRWADIAFGEEFPVQDPTALSGGLAAPIGESQVSRNQAFDELNRTMALNERVVNGDRIWVPD
jgi:hypothetical protein